MATRNKRLKIEDNFAARIITFTHEDGRTHVANVDALPEEIRNMSIVKGIHNKLMDSYADAEKWPDPFVPMLDVWQSLCEGNWNTRGEGAERTGLFVEAYAHVKKMEVAAVRTLVNNIEASEDPARVEALKSVRSHPQIKAAMARIAEERAKARRVAAQDAAKKTDVPVLGDLV